MTLGLTWLTGSTSDLVYIETESRLNAAAEMRWFLWLVLIAPYYLFQYYHLFIKTRPDYNKWCLYVVPHSVSFPPHGNVAMTHGLRCPWTCHFAPFSPSSRLFEAGPTRIATFLGWRQGCGVSLGGTLSTPLLNTPVMTPTQSSLLQNRQSDRSSCWFGGGGIVSWAKFVHRAKLSNSQKHFYCSFLHLDLLLGDSCVFEMSWVTERNKQHVLFSILKIDTK